MVEFHKRRREAYPAETTIKEQQSFKVLESAVLVSPYHVQKQTLEVTLPKDGTKVVGLTKHADSKVKDNKIEYGGVRKNVEPFSFEQISVMFMN